MRAPVFLDTNVIVYAYDNRDHAKQKTARALLESVTGDDTGVISTQVIQEFCNVTRTKLSVVTKIPLVEIIDDVLTSMLQHVPNIAFYKRALQLITAHSLGFYDALIVQAAIDLGCETLYSEDLQDGQKFGSLSVKNPFIA